MSALRKGGDIDMMKNFDTDVDDMIFGSVGTIPSDR